MKTRAKSMLIMSVLFLIAAIRNLVCLNPKVSYMGYFGMNQIWLTPGLRMMCLFGGIFFLIAAISMVVFVIHEKLQKNKAHAINNLNWDKELKVPPELMKKVEKADEISMSELEHLSDKKD